VSSAGRRSAKQTDVFDAPASRPASRAGIDARRKAIGAGRALAVVAIVGESQDANRRKAIACAGPRVTLDGTVSCRPTSGHHCGPSPCGSFFVFPSVIALTVWEMQNGRRRLRRGLIVLAALPVLYVLTMPLVVSILLKVDPPSGIRPPHWLRVYAAPLGTLEHTPLKGPVRAYLEWTMRHLHGLPPGA
jgi:hypothetical protein